MIPKNMMQKQKSSRKKKLINVAIILCVIIVGFVAFRIVAKVIQGNKKATPIVYTVGSKILKKQMVSETLTFQGSIEGDPQVKVYPPVSGKFQGNAVQEGSYVTVDQPLVYINRDIIGSDYKLAPVKSPISGVVTKLYFLDRGTAISPDKPVAEVANARNIKVVINVGEDDLMKIKKGQAVRVHSANDEKIGLNASVFSVPPFVDRDTLSGTITIKMINLNSIMKIGMTVAIDITIGRKNAYMVPEEAVISGLDNVYIYINKDNIAKQVIVTRGYSQDGFVEISSPDLHDGDEIITEGSFKLNDGAKIQVTK